MSNRYKIYSELNMGVAKLDPGKKSFEELYKLAKEFREDKDFGEVNFQVNDLRGCDFDFDKKKIGEMASLVEEYQDADNQQVGVFITDRPISTAYIQLFFNSISYRREFCSSLEGAYHILKPKVKFEEFKKLLDI